MTTKGMIFSQSIQAKIGNVDGEAKVIDVRDIATDLRVSGVESLNYFSRDGAIIVRLIVEVELKGDGTVELTATPS